MYGSADRARCRIKEKALKVVRAKFGGRVGSRGEARLAQDTESQELLSNRTEIVYCEDVDVYMGCRRVADRCLHES